MQAIIRNNHKTFDPSEVVEIAKKLKESDPDWNYIARHDPSGRGKSVIDVFDEEGNFISMF